MKKIVIHECQDDASDMFYCSAVVGAYEYLDWYVWEDDSNFGGKSVAVSCVEYCPFCGIKLPETINDERLQLEKVETIPEDDDLQVPKDRSFCFEEFEEEEAGETREILPEQFEKPQDYEALLADKNKWDTLARQAIQYDLMARDYPSIIHYLKWYTDGQEQNAKEAGEPERQIELLTLMFVFQMGAVYEKTRISVNTEN